MNSLHLTWFSIKLPKSRKTIFLIIYFNWRIITILWWFLPYISMNRPQVYMCTPILNHIYASSNGKERACNVGDLGLIPRLGTSPGEGNSYSLQYFGLENSMDCILYGVAKSQTWLLTFTSTFTLRFWLMLVFMKFCRKLALFWGDKPTVNWS